MTFDKQTKIMTDIFSSCPSCQHKSTSMHTVQLASACKHIVALPGFVDKFIGSEIEQILLLL